MDFQARTNSFYLIKLDQEPRQEIWAMVVYSEDSPATRSRTSVNESSSTARARSP